MTRKTWVLAGAAVLALATAIGGVVIMSSGKEATPITQQPVPNTVKVDKRELTSMVSLNGTLTYRANPDGSPYVVIDQAGGTYTELPVPGQVISEGQVLYRVNDSPVVLLYGPTPAYRTLSVGATGADVVELNAGLVRLGYATSGQLSPTSTAFTSATATAVEQLQAALGTARNGTLSLGQAAFEPTAVRVTTVAVPLGASTQSGQTVMEATSTTRQVDVAVDGSQQSEMAVGESVTITLPNNQTTPGVVSSVGTVATCPSSVASGGSTTSSAATPTVTCPSADSGSNTAPTITVDVTPSDPPATGKWDQAPVQVTITTATTPSGLVVPVTALLAQSGGGYAVEVADPGRAHHLVSVSLGLFDDADGLVQITSSGLAAGQEVTVPTT